MRFHKQSIVLLALLTITSCVPIPSTLGSDNSWHNPYFKAQEEAQQAQNQRNDSEEAVKIWIAALPQYQDGTWELTRAVILNRISTIYKEEKRFGEALKYAEQSDAILDAIEKKGLETVDDDGYGSRVKGTAYGLSNRVNTQSNSFRIARMGNDSIMMEYYRAAGESEKADELGREMSQQSEQFTQDTYEMTKRTYLQSLREQAKYDSSLTEERIQREAEQKAREAKAAEDARKEAVNEVNRLGFEIRSRGLAGGTDVEPLIDQFVQLIIDQDQINSGMFLNMAKTYEQQDDMAAARDFRNMAEHHLKNYMEPWGMAVKASLLFEIGRAKEALPLLDRARARITHPAPMPQLTSETGRYWGQYGLGTGKPDLITWDFIRARILTKLNDPRALAAWNKVFNELNTPLTLAPNASATEKNAHLMAVTMRRHILGSTYQELAATEIADLHEKQGSRSQGLAYIDQLLKERESTRASFSVESHKRGYLAGNKHLYERYLTLSTADARQNLLGMERAKSRGMVDLMAEGVGAINDPTLQMVSMYRQKAVADLGKSAEHQSTRSIDRAFGKQLETLRKQNPELHSLISVDVAGADELVSLLGADTVALSYYVADKTLFINVIGRGVRKVVALPIDRGSLFGAVYDYRQRLLDPATKRNPKGGRVSVDWTLKNDVQRMTLTNHMPFPLEIRGVHSVSSGYSSMVYPYLPTSYRIQSQVKPREDTIAPGKTGVIFEQETVKSPWSYSYVAENYIETNLGSAYISGMMFSQANAPDQLNIKERQGFTYTPLRGSLYDALIKPVAQYIKGKQLVIVPHSVLHFLPFETLKDSRGRYLVQDHAVSYAPSLNTLLLCRAKSRDTPTKLVAYGDPLGDLAFARTEVDAVRQLFDQSTVLIGQEVTTQSVASTIGQGDVVHFACHGIFDPAAPLNSALVMSGSGQRGNPQNYNLLTVSEIMKLKTRPSLVFLSACDTGRARISGGDELIGLVRGFFVAGSPSLVTTLWPIDDKSTAILALRFYENMLQRGMDKRLALQEAKLFLMKNGYENPYYWAAFVLQGDWR